MVTQECIQNGVELVDIELRTKPDNQIRFYIKGTTTPAMLHIRVRNMCSFVSTEAVLHEDTLCTAFVCHF